MFKSADAILNRKQLANVVDDYFAAWQSHNTTLLRKIFKSNARYIIRNKDSEMIGIDEIVAYWRRNKRRQHGLKLQWKIISITKGRSDVSFHAQFFDSEEAKSMHVGGIINFYFDQKRKISTLSEYYEKTYPKTDFAQNKNTVAKVIS